MKQLLLMRHAKSDWGDPSLDDFERPLNTRGNKAAPAMGKYIQGKNYTPQLILCSAAQRTRETAAHVMAEMTPPPDIDHLQSLYLATPNDMIQALRAVPDTTDRVMLITHNPGMHSLAITLAHYSLPGAHEALVWNFPTAALAVYELDIESWRDVRREDSKLVDYMVPKKLPKESLGN